MAKLPEERPCTKCGLSGSETLFRYYKGRRLSWCKSCKKQYDSDQYHIKGVKHYSTASKKSHFKRQYGVSLDFLENLWLQQNGLCAICKKEVPNPARVNVSCKTHVDHCHKSGRIRGLLCFACNSGLGKFEDSPLLLQAALDYLQR